MGLFDDLLKSIKETGRINANGIGPARITHFLESELVPNIRALPSSEARNFATKAVADFAKGTLTLELGTEDVVSVPLTTFCPPSPNFALVKIVDGGQKVTFGSYGVPVDVVVHEWSLLQAENPKK